jgi:DNA/RNA-binding domain of Phe-tRNA-synthetase-like protein
MIPILVDPHWSLRFPDACMGLLEVHGLEPLATHPRLEELRLALEQVLRREYGGLDRRQLRELPAMRAFEAHCRPLGRTYHVLQQLESVAVKGRSIPARICAVTALFMAELQHGLVAAGHDLDTLEAPLLLAPSRGGERYLSLGGLETVLPEGDMTLGHAKGLLSSVLQGPDHATPITPGTRNALFTLYAPASVSPERLEAQLQDLRRYLTAFSPEARFERVVVP